MSATVSSLFRNSRLTVACLAAIACLASVAAGAPAASADVVPQDHITVTVTPHPLYTDREALVTAVARTATGSTDTTFNSSATWSDSSGVIADSTPLHFVGGVSRTVVTFTGPAHRDVITVTDDTFGLTGSSLPFEVIGPLARVGVSVPAAVTSGSAFTVTARAYDAVGHFLNFYAGPATWTHAAPGASLTPDAPSDFVNGVSSTPVTAGAPVQNDALTVTTGGVSGTSRSYDVQLPAETLGVKIPSTVKPGVPFTLVVSALDENGAVVTSYNRPGDWSFIGGDTVSGSLSRFVGGISRTTVVMSNPEPLGYLAVTTDDALSGMSSYFRVIGPFVRLTGVWTVTGGDPETCLGVTGSVVLLALDAAGNTVTSYSGTGSWELNSNPSGATIEPAAPAPFVHGVSTNPAVTLDNAPGATAINLATQSGGIAWTQPLICGR